jgi:hypothetical protein
MTLKRTIGAGAFLLACFALGCGGGNPNAPANVSGSVTYKGKPVPAGSVQYVTSDGVAYSSPLAKDGTFSISDVPVGELVIVVETDSAKEFKAPKDPNTERRMNHQQQRPGSDGGGAAPEPEAPVYVKIPEKYGKAKTSPLTQTLKVGRNTNQIELTD